MIICDDNSKQEYFEDIVNVCSYAKELLEKEKYEEAIKVLRSKIRIVEKYKTIGKKECFCFDELFEYEMYIHHKNDDNIIWVKEPVTDLYDLYVHLIESINQNEDEINECVNDMISALKAALRWNPCSAELRFELFKVLLLLKKDIVAASVVLKEAYSYIYRLKTMMQFYRCLGWKFRIEENWDAAMLCTQMSMTFTDDYGVALSEELMEEIYME